MNASSEPAAVIIRPVTATDVGSILRLIRELAEFERLAHEVIATEELLRAHLFGERPAGEVLLAESDDGAAVGFALFFQNFSTFVGRPGIYLEDLYVQPAWRNRGLGRALFQHIARLAVERGCGRFEWSVLEWNANAIAFYEKLGATVRPDWRICRVTGEKLARLGEG